MHKVVEAPFRLLDDIIKTIQVPEIETFFTDDLEKIDKVLLDEKVPRFAAFRLACINKLGLGVEHFVHDLFGVDASDHAVKILGFLF